MRAAVIEAVGRVVVRDVPNAVPAQQAMVHIERGGVCGTDLKILSGAIPVRFPLIVGHEMVGRVVEPGPAQLLAEGTRVLVNPNMECGICRLCRADRGHLCPTGTLRGRDADGGFAEFMAVDEDRLHPIPDSLSLDDASLLQVLGTCVHAQTMVDVFPGQSAVVVGLGVSGFLHLQLLRARGITNVVGVTRSAWKRELAMQMGATAVATPEEAPAVVAQLTDGEGADLVVESVGQPSTLQQAVELAGPGGTVLVFGIGPARTELAAYQCYFKEISMVNSRAARSRDYARAVQLAAEGAVHLAPLVTARFPLEDVAKAFDVCRSGEQLKVMLEIA
jgi:2-desacetyl-2-hydroxyethyl bacteriochlorophyllide A dehydrogenase